MKKASRFMPKKCLPANRCSGLGSYRCYFLHLCLAALVCSSFVDSFTFHSSIFYREHRERKRYFQDLLASREGYSICEFSRHFECRQVDTWVIRAVYEQLQKYLKSYEIELPVLPNDDVFSDLKIDDEDFEYGILEEIAFRTGRSLDDAEVNPYFGKANIVENLVYFFNKQPFADAI